MAPRYIFSPSFPSSNDGVNHLIAFFSKRTFIFRSSSAYPVARPDLHTSPRGLVTRLHFLKRLPVFPLPLAAPAFSPLFVAAHFRRLTFFLDENALLGWNEKKVERLGFDPSTLPKEWTEVVHSSPRPRCLGNKNIFDNFYRITKFY